MPPKARFLPAKYQPGFLDALDRRTPLYRTLRDRYDTIVGDLGGEEAIGAVKRTMIERFVFLEATLQTFENKIIEAPQEAQPLLGLWIQGLNSLTGLGRQVGIEVEKKAKPWAKVLSVGGGS